MSISKPTFTPTGITLPAELTLLSEIQADMNTAFGGGLNPALETPQGQLASSLTAAVAAKNSEFAYIVNQVDPQYSDGAFQDAIGRIYFMSRNPATPTVVTVTLTGIAGTVVPTGTLAQDTSDNTYVCDGSVTIGAGGTVSATFSNILTGPIPCAAGTLTQVYQAIPGWDAINNPSAGVVGRVVESRADFEYRRRNSVALNAHGSLPAIYAAVFDVPDVLDVYATENPTGSAVNTGSTNYPLAAHSLYVAAVGGTDDAVAKAIWGKKNEGSNYNGNTTVNVTDESGYSYPYPTYAVKFVRPAALGIKFAVQIVNNPMLPADIVSRVKTAIIARFNGADGTSRERIGSTIFASRYYGAITPISSVMSVLSILIGTTTATLPQVLVGIDHQPTLDVADIAVTLV